MACACSPFKVKRHIKPQVSLSQITAFGMPKHRYGKLLSTLSDILSVGFSIENNLKLQAIFAAYGNKAYLCKIKMLQKKERISVLRVFECNLLMLLDYKLGSLILFERCYIRKA